ncbi:MAG: Hpt domain-containing protein [Gammaproteobacteria bacterium]
MINALWSHDDPLKSLKTAVVSDLAAARHAIDGYEMATAGEGLRRLAGILDMALLPMAQRFCDEIAELTLAAAAGAAGDPQAARRLAERAIRALRDYLDGISDGTGTNPMRFLPLLDEMAQARGVPPVSAHDLCSFDIPVDLAGPLGREADTQEDLMVRLKREHETYQRGLLRWFQGDAGGLAAMRGALGGVLRTQPASRRALWWVASALVEGLQMADTDTGPEVKKLCARIEQELRRLRSGAAESGSPLLCDVLYAIATTCPDGPRAHEVSAWYGLDKVFPDASGREVEVSAEGRSGHEAAQESLHAARDALERFHDGTDGALDECVGHVSEARRKLRPFSPGALTDLLDAIANRAGSRASDQTDRLALDLAEALIIADDACRRPLPSQTVTQFVTDYANELCFLGTASRTHSIEIADVLRMSDAAAPVATEILKRLRQAQHLLGNLSEETVKPSEIDGLGDSISQCASVFDMLGAVRAETLCALCAARIAEVKAADWAASEETMIMIAEGISGLDLYCMALEQGLADPERPLQAVFEHLGLADPGTPPARPQDLVEGPAFVNSGDPEPSENPSEVDAKLLSVFLEEALGVLRNMERQLAAVRDDPSDVEALAELRRVFHTLTGSSRMVRLDDLGHVAHALEDTLDFALDQGRPATGGLVTLIELAYRRFGEWIDALGRDGRADIDQAELLGLASRVRNGEETSILTPGACTMAATGHAAAHADVALPESATLDASAEVVIGDAVMSVALFESFAGEALVHHQTLKLESEHLSTHGLCEIRPEFLRASHTLAGISRTAGLSHIGDLAGALEQWLQALAEDPHPLTTGGRDVMWDAIAALGGMIDAARRRQCPEPNKLSESAVLTARIDSLCAAVADASELPTIEQPSSPGSLGVHGEPAIVVEHEPPPAPVQAPEHASERHSRLGLLIDSAQELLSNWSTRRRPIAEPPALVATDGASHPVTEIAVPDIVAAEPKPIASIPQPAAEGLDTEILAFFVEEASELLSAIGSGLRAWRADPSDNGASQQLLRVLHNFKGSAHTVGAVHLCRLAHDMEDRVQALVDHGDVPAVIFDALDESFDHLALATEALQKGQPVQPQPQSHAADPGAQTLAPALLSSDRTSDALVQTLELTPLSSRAAQLPDATSAPGGSGVRDHQTLLRIRAEVADRLVNQAGEISIARSRIETEMEAFERGLSDLAATTGRVREQLHEIAIQAESQLQSRLSQVKSDDANFDPLEFDRYTRLQELTRMIAEGVSDVATVQQGLARTLEHTTAALAEQRRIDREHHRDLMRLRAAPFSTITERLYRAVRQAARESGKKVDLTIRGGHVEINRTVIERMIAPLEHVLRNAVVHGIEPIEERRRAGKPEVGMVTVALRPEATEIRLTVSDDGAGLDVGRIRDKALARGLITLEQPLLDEEAMQLIFSHGLSTAEEITGLSGRGVGMDIVMSELGAIGGRVKVTSKRGKGAYFSFFLPVMLGITQALLVRAGIDVFPIPTVLVGQVVAGRSVHDQAGRLRESIEHLGRRYKVHYLPVLLGKLDATAEGTRASRVLLLRAGDERIAVLVDEVLGSRKIMVKDVGAQIGSVQGILGATVLGDGRGVLIINPIEFARRGDRAIPAAGAARPVEASARTPLVLVVDDSLTVRKFTTRLLAREGFRVATARDGVEALDKVRVALPDVILLDIEMPRMDGFELTRVLHSDSRTAGIPIIMITSRTAEKHHQYAMDLGVRVYLGKPYSERDLVTHIAHCTDRRAA